MKFISPILAIIVCAAAAYFTLTASEKFQKEQTTRLDAISTNKTVTAKADGNDVAIEKLEVELEASKQNLDVATASAEILESTERTLQTDLSRLDDQVASQDVELEALNKTLEAVKVIFKDLGFEGEVDINNLVEKINEIQEDTKTKRAKVEELETLITGAKSTLVKKQDTVARLVDRKQTRNVRISLNAMEARITAVNQDWGFLVIGAGSNSGFTPQTTLLVKRDGKLIGRVNPSAIEPTQTIAEIDFKALSPGVLIQPGDQVILANPAGN